MTVIYWRCRKQFAIFIEINPKLGWSPVRMKKNIFGERIIDTPYAQIIFTPLNQILKKQNMKRQNMKR